MNLYKEAGEAYSNAYKRYVRAKNEEIMYVFPCKVGRSEFFTVMSQKEAKKYKVSPAKAWYTFGDTDYDKKHREELQTKLSDPKIKEYDAKVRYIKTLRQHLRAEEKLKKLNTDDAK